MIAITNESSAAVKTTYPQYRFVIAGLILFANFSIGLNWYSVAPLMPPIMMSFSITASLASLLVALPLLIKSIVGLPGSVILARYGLQHIFTVSWFMLGALTLSWVAPNYLALLVLRLCYGIGAAFMMPAMGTLVMQWFPANERTIVNSVNLVIISLGITFSYAVAAPLASITSWQFVLGLFGAIGLLGAVAWSLLGRTQTHMEDERVIFTINDVGEVLQNKTILLLLLGDSLVFTCYAALSDWLPSYYFQIRGLSLSRAGNITGLLSFIGIFAVLLGGYLTMKVKEKKLMFIIPGILVALGGFGSFLASNITVIYLSVILLGIGAWVYQPILLSLPMELDWMTPNKIAIVWGASMTIAGFGMFVSPIIVGASQDYFGSYLPGFIASTLPALMLIFTGIFLPANERVGKTLGGDQLI